jgi:DNA-binding transcriptional ArsR family regulator
MSPAALAIRRGSVRRTRSCRILLTCRKVPTYSWSMVDVDVFSALANPVRREILVRLQRGPRGATDLARGFAIGRPAVSEHLQVLRRARLIREEPRGRERYYHLDPRPLTEVGTWLDAFTRYWKQRLAALDELLEEEARK